MTSEVTVDFCGCSDVLVHCVAGNGLKELETEKVFAKAPLVLVAAGLLVWDVLGG